MNRIREEQKRQMFEENTKLKLDSVIDKGELILILKLA